MTSQWQGLAHAVESAALFTSTDKTANELQAVEVRWDPERNANFATATDRYVLAEQAFGTGTPDPEDWRAFLVGPDDVKTLVKRGDPQDLTVEQDKVTLTYADGGRWTFVSHPGHLPDGVRRLWERNGDELATDHCVIKPHLLARLGRVRPYTDDHAGTRPTVNGSVTPVRLEFQGPHKPMRAYIGDRFRALVVAVRTS